MIFIRWAKSFCDILLALFATIHPPLRVSQILVAFGDGLPIAM